MAVAFPESRLHRAPTKEDFECLSVAAAPSAAVDSSAAAAVAVEVYRHLNLVLEPLKPSAGFFGAAHKSDY